MGHAPQAQRDWFCQTAHGRLVAKRAHDDHRMDTGVDAMTLGQ